VVSESALRWSVAVVENVSQFASEGLELAGVAGLAAEEAPVAAREHGRLLAEQLTSCSPPLAVDESHVVGLEGGHESVGDPHRTIGGHRYSMAKFDLVEELATVCADDGEGVAALVRAPGRVNNAGIGNGHGFPFGPPGDPAPPTAAEYPLRVSTPTQLAVKIGPTVRRSREGDDPAVVAELDTS
jgi:hypothetical protein